VWIFLALEQLGLDGPEVLPGYVGDDVTDEDPSVGTQLRSSEGVLGGESRRRVGRVRIVARRLPLL
jgi:hypothetical protein